MQFSGASLSWGSCFIHRVRAIDMSILLFTFGGFCVYMEQKACQLNYTNSWLLARSATDLKLFWGSRTRWALVFVPVISCLHMCLVSNRPMVWGLVEAVFLRYLNLYTGSIFQNFWVWEFLSIFQKWYGIFLNFERSKSTVAKKHGKITCVCRGHEAKWRCAWLTKLAIKDPACAWVEPGSSETISETNSFLCISYVVCARRQEAHQNEEALCSQARTCITMKKRCVCRQEAHQNEEASRDHARGRRGREARRLLHLPREGEHSVALAVQALLLLPMHQGMIAQCWGHRFHTILLTEAISFYHEYIR